jgi:hypothetical protein
VLWSGDHVFEGTVETLELLRAKGVFHSFSLYSIFAPMTSSKLKHQGIIHRHPDGKVTVALLAMMIGPIVTLLEKVASFVRRLGREGEDLSSYLVA